ncbi:MAG: hypothetical protein OXG66_14370, partial [Acidimicrobiaceae bacterium]|nr:hypothetical protein [Acidimicrobiaceae bacterium]
MTAVETPQAPRKTTPPGPERAGRGEPPGWLVRLKRQKLASYVILLVFAVLYIGPLLMLVTTAFKTLPEFFQNPTGMPES